MIFEYPDDNGERRDCGLLTERAYHELEGTLAALDPSVDYGDHPADCNPHGALVHIEGFDRALRQLDEPGPGEISRRGSSA